MMKRLTISILLLAFVTFAGYAIDNSHFQRGTAVLKGRILNKPADKWNILSVVIYNVFTDEEQQVLAIPVAADGSFESRIPLPYSQSIKVRDVDFMFLATPWR